MTNEPVGAIMAVSRRVFERRLENAEDDIGICR